MSHSLKLKGDESCFKNSEPGHEFTLLVDSFCHPIGRELIRWSGWFYSFYSLGRPLPSTEKTPSLFKCM